MAELSLQHQAILKRYHVEIMNRNIVQLKEMKQHMINVFGEPFHQIKENSLFREGDNNIDVNTYLTVLRNRVNEVHYTFTMHFPEITIINRTGKTHPIKDLYVRFFMRGDLRLVSTSINSSGTTTTLAGLRTTYTPQEWAADYAHSHLPGKTSRFECFCTGDGPIVGCIRRLAARYNSNQFYGFLQIIKGYVCYESIEGGPYRFISNIGTDTRAPLATISLSAEQSQKLFENNLQLFLQEYKLLSYSVDESKVEVTITDEFNIKLAQSIRANFNTFRDLFGSLTMDQLTPLKMTDGRYCTAVSSTRIPNYTPATLIEFKGQPKQLFIGYATNASTTDNTRYTHPTIIELLCKQYSRYLTTTAIKLQNPGW